MNYTEKADSLPLKEIASAQVRIAQFEHKNDIWSPFAWPTQKSEFWFVDVTGDETMVEAFTHW